MNDQRMDQYRNTTLAGMNTLLQCLNKVMEQGYKESFAVKANGLFALSHDRSFTPPEVHIINFYRFEGPSNPDDMAILYVIETADGTKGTLIDAYGTYADGSISEFIKDVEDIHKKITK